MNLSKFLYVIAGIMHLACFSFATHELSSPKIRGEDTSVNLQSLRIINISQTNERKMSSPCKTFAFNGGVGTNPLRDTDDYSATDGQSLKEYCSSNNCCTGGSGQECRDWSPNPQVTYEICPSSCHGDDSCTGIANESAAGTVISIQPGSCHGEGSCYRIAKNSPQVLSVRIEENSCLGRDSCTDIGADRVRVTLNESFLKKVHIGPYSCTRDFSCDSAGDGTTSPTAKHAGVIIPENECNSHIGSCKNCAKDTLFTGTVVITESCCSIVSDEGQYQNFDAACSETNAPSISIMPSISSAPSSSPSLSLKPSSLSSLCKTFAFNGGVGTNTDDYSDTDDYSATDGQSLKEYCSLNDCCTGRSYQQECRDWSPNPQVTYEICPSSCHGDDSCTGIANESAAGTVVSIQPGSCRGEGSCYRIAKNSPQVLSVHIEENSCLGKDSCNGIGAENESNLAIVQIGPSSCTKDFSCDSAGDGTNSQTTKHAGVIIPENECNSHIGSCKNCAKDTLFTGTVVITESCCSVVSDEEQNQHFDTACYETNAPSISLMPSVSSVPSSSPSLSLEPSLSTMPSPHFKPSVLPSLYPSNAPSKQIDCAAVTYYYPDAGMDTSQSDRGSLSPLTDHACSYPDQNYIVEEDVYRYGPSCCTFDYNTKQCGLWVNYSARGGDGGFLYPCSFGPIDESEEPSQFPSLDFSFEPSLLPSSSPSTAKSNIPSSSSSPSSIPSTSQSLKPSQVPSSFLSQLPSLSPSILSSSNPTSTSSASEECKNVNEAPFDIEIKLNDEIHDNVIKIMKYNPSTRRFSKRIFRKGKKKFDTAYATYNWRVCLDKSECYRFVIRDLGDANGFTSGDEMAYVKLHWDGQKIKRSRFRYNLKRMRKKFGNCFGDSGNIFT